MQNMRLKMVLKSAVIAIAVIAAYIAGYRFFGIGLRCPVRTLTGLLCPACGMTHALGAAVRGHFALAMRYNALSLTLFPACVIWLFLRAVRYVRTGNDSFSTGEKILFGLCLVICAVYFVQRNHLI